MISMDMESRNATILPSMVFSEIEMQKGLIPLCFKSGSFSSEVVVPLTWYPFATNFSANGRPNQPQPSIPICLVKFYFLNG